MKVLELFAGTRSIGRAFERRGHEVFYVDWGEFENIDLTCDIEYLEAATIIERFGHPDVIWASPDCTTYSVAAISKHRRLNEHGELVPVSEYARKCDRVNRNVLRLIKKLRPTLFFIENPRGALRKMPFMQDIPRYSVTYCQYGETRMKPTDIFTNCPNPEFKHCHNGATCHEPAPRGARTGTQGIKGKIDRARIPTALCDHIVLLCENYIGAE